VGESIGQPGQPATLRVPAIQTVRTGSRPNAAAPEPTIGQARNCAVSTDERLARDNGT